MVKPVDLNNLPDKITPKKKRVGRPTLEEQRIKARSNKKPGDKRIVGNRTYYSDKFKLEVACSYALVGNSRRVSELHGVSEATIRGWKTTEWWADIMSRIQKEQDEELTTKMTNILDKTVASINDRLDNGDFIYDAKRGEFLRKPVGIKELAIVSAITVDKRELLRGKPTSRTENVSTDQRLLRLAEQFSQFAKAKEVVQVDNENAFIEGGIQENDVEQYQDENKSWETSEVGDSDSLLDEEEENQEEEIILTVNELFSE